MLVSNSEPEFLQTVCDFNSHCIHKTLFVTTRYVQLFIRFSVNNTIW